MEQDIKMISTAFITVFKIAKTLMQPECLFYAQVDKEKI